MIHEYTTAYLIFLICFLAIIIVAVHHAHFSRTKGVVLCRGAATYVDAVGVTTTPFFEPLLQGLQFLLEVLWHHEALAKVVEFHIRNGVVHPVCGGGIAHGTFDLVVGNVVARKTATVDTPKTDLTDA